MVLSGWSERDALTAVAGRRRISRAAKRGLAAVLVVVPAVMSPAVTPVMAQGEPEAEVVLEGRGWGHGVGMAQDGALAMGAAGSSTEDILATFYPGTSLASGGGNVEVAVVDGQPAVEIAFPAGGEVLDSASGEQSPGFPVTVSPGGSVSLFLEDGLYRAEPLAGAAAAPLPEADPAEPADPAVPSTPPPPAIPTSSRPLWAVPPDGSSTVVGDHRYRGVLQASGGGGGIQVVNRVDVEDYLRGMGEIRDPGAPATALQAQAIAARTYAVRAVRAGRTLCRDERCQVCLGTTGEYAAMDAAVADTAGQVLVYEGSLAETVYSASGGGISASPEEGFGDNDAQYPYLRVTPYPTGDPHLWDLRTPLAEMAARFAYPGAASGAAVTRVGPSGRALEVTFDGDSGAMAVDIHRFSAELNLRSTLFTLRVDVPPPALAEGQAAAGGVRIARPPPEVILYGAPAAPARPLWIAVALLVLVAAGTAGWARGRSTKRLDT